MHARGYLALVDVSKFSHQFATYPEDQHPLRLKHPSTGVLYYYMRLPMGRGSSPAIVRQYILALLWMLYQKCVLFKGEETANCWWSSFSKTGFEPGLGYGIILKATDRPAMKIWVWVDNFLIHGPTHKKTMNSLNFFLDYCQD
jgi:hypothetical protein